MDDVGQQPDGTEARDVRRYVELPVDAAQVERARARLDRQLKSARPPSRARWAAVGVASIGVITVTWALMRGSAPNGTPPAANRVASQLPIEGSPPSGRLRLEDGSTIEAGPEARVRTVSTEPTSVVVALDAGSATFAVTRNPARDFVVMVEGVRVRVIGTRFSVGLEEDADSRRVRVRVVTGHVEVLPPEGAVIDLHDREEVVISLDVRARAAEEASSRAAAPDAPGDGAGASDEVVSTRLTPRRPARRPVRDSVAPARPSAAELFASGNQASQAGRFDQSILFYEQLLREYPRDDRASLAAYETGRLRMDHRNDVHGAVRDLERAIRLAPRGALRQEATARLVRAHEQLGDHRACARARADYLWRFPEGRHADDVRRRCP